MKKRINVVEKRVTKLEKAALLFEKHRQEWIQLGKGMTKLKQEMDRDKRKELAQAKRERTAPQPLGSGRPVR